METEANKMTKQPSYRFAGYTDFWVEKKLGEVADRYDNLRVPVSANERISGSTPYYGANGIQDYVDGYTHDGEFILIAEDGASDLKDYPVQYVNGKVWVNNHAHVIQGKHDLTKNLFLLFAVKRINIEPFLVGGGRAKLNSDVMMKLPLHLSSLPEQTAIGSFFQDIDQLISLQQHKLEVLKEQKKTYLKLLFPAKGQTKPALRFAGFEDGWKEVKLGKMLKKNNKKNRDLAINNVESVSNKLGFVKQTEQFEDYSVASADLSNYYVISEKQFAYNPSRINVGSIAYKKEGDTLSVVSPLYISFSTVENIDDPYLWYWFKTSLFDSQRAIYSEGGVRDTLSFNQLSDIELIFPYLPEQEAIGSFFQDLDKAIAKQEEKVNQLKESKQTFLKKMFI